MKTLGVCRSALWLVAISFACASVFAQSEKIALRVVPQPNQTVMLRTVQETEVEMTIDNDPTPAAAGLTPIKLMTKTVAALTQKSGKANADGRIETEMTYDELSLESKMNGQPMPANDTTRGFLGKKVIVTYDQQGNVVDLRVPSDVGIPEEAFRRMLTSMYGNLPDTLLSIGESATVPLDFSLPIPIPNSGPLKMDGTVKHMLVSIEKDAGGRIAKFDHAIDGKMVGDLEMRSPAGQLKMSLDFVLKGGGAMVRDLDKGLIRSSESNATFEGKIRLSGEPNAPQGRSMSMRGTTKTTTTSGN